MQTYVYEYECSVSVVIDNYVGQMQSVASACNIGHRCG